MTDNCQSDVNDDGKVNSTDLLIVSKARGPKGAANYVSDLDVNRDGKINSTDLLLVANNRGRCASD